MENTKFSQAVSEVLAKKLINDMQSILDELKSRLSFPDTKILRDLPVGDDSSRE